MPNASTAFASAEGLSQPVNVRCSLDRITPHPTLRLSRPSVDPVQGPYARRLVQLEARMDGFAHAHGAHALRISIGIVFAWFGVLKFFPSISPAEEIAVQTLRALTFELIPARGLLLGLASFEAALGACFVLGKFGRIVLPLLALHMLGTATPFLLFPAQLFVLPLVPTFLGQYILKNIIIVSAALALRRSFR